jgi:pimeloyl-ACP methyl ester carboxylesterase
MAILMTPPTPDREGNIARGIKVFRTIGSPGFPFDEERIRNIAGRSFDRGFHPEGVARQIVAIFASGNRKPLLASVTCPTLVLHGTDDVLVRFEGGVDTAAAIAGAKLVAIEGMGHDMPRPVWPTIVGEICELAARG